MTTTTLIPDEAQTTLYLESPLTAQEKAEKLQLEARSSAAAASKFEKQRIMADCLLRIYQDKLFRGEQGGRSWGDYLAKEIGLLGYGSLTTESAANELNWEVLNQAIDQWNEQNPHKVLGYPRSRSYMEGWTTLFDRKISKGGGSAYMPFSDDPAVNALNTWKTGCFKLGSKGMIPDRREANAIGRAARDQGLGRLATVGTVNTVNLPRSQPGWEAEPEPVQEIPRTVSPEVERMAEEAKAAREAARLDPRDMQVESKHDPVPMSDAETYCNIMGRLQMEAQTLEVWLTGRLNLYGTDGLNFLRNQVDLGIYDVSDDVTRITAIKNRLENVLDLLTEHIEPGELTPDSFTSEPSL